MPPSDQECDWIEQVLGLRPGAATDPAERNYQALHATVTLDLARLRGTMPEAVAPAAALATQAEGLAARGAWQDAFGLLDQAATSLANVQGAARAGAAAAAIPAGTVAAITALLDQAEDLWDRALHTAEAAAGAVRHRLETGFPEAADGLDSILDSYWADLADAIDDGRKAGDDAAARAPMLATVRSLRAEMQADALFAWLDRSGAAVGAAFLDALDRMEALLNATAQPAPGARPS